MKFKEAKHMLKSYAGMTHKLSDNQGRPKLDQAIDLVLKELETYKKIAEKLTIEFAKELNKASLVMLDGRFIGGERERVLRFYKPEDIGIDIKVNEVGKDVQLNEKIFHSGKHFLELKFYHNESIDALIHRLEHLKTL